MKVTLDHTTTEAGNIITFYFRPEKPLHYTAGQYVELTLPHEPADMKGIKRWFTLSSSPLQELVSITTKFVPEGSSFKKALGALKPSAVVNMSEPMGDFVLPKDRQQPLIFVAGGIGLTPFHSMFEWLAEQGEHRDITFIYGVQNEDEIIFQDTFERAGIHATIIVSQPSETWGGERGPLSAELICGLTKPSPESLIYLSGPEPMIEHLARDLVTQGVTSHQIVTDLFQGYQTI